jgi:hypothetical protein
MTFNYACAETQVYIGQHNFSQQMTTEPEVVTKYIETIVEKPITKVVEVEKIVERPVITERVIEVERIVEKPITVEVQRI